MTPKTYRNVVIEKSTGRRMFPVEAVQWTGDNDDVVMEFLGVDELHIKTSNPPYLSLQTLVGHRLANVGDWLVRISPGKLLQPLSDDEFKLMYVPEGD